MLHTLRLLVLVAFMAGSSGWVLHRHWCPEGLEARLSLTGPSTCSMEAMALQQAPPAKADHACCSKPAAPVADAGCAEQGNCCRDAQALLAGLAPFVVEEPTAAPHSGCTDCSLHAMLLPRAQNGQLPNAQAVHPPGRPAPPPPTAERLSLVQVYRL